MIMEAINEYIGLATCQGKFCKRNPICMAQDTKFLDLVDSNL